MSLRNPLRDRTGRLVTFPEVSLADNGRRRQAFPLPAVLHRPRHRGVASTGQHHDGREIAIVSDIVKQGQGILATPVDEGERVKKRVLGFRDSVPSRQAWTGVCPEADLGCRDPAPWTLSALETSHALDPLQRVWLGGVALAQSRRRATDEGGVLLR